MFVMTDSERFVYWRHISYSWDGQVDVLEAWMRKGCWRSIYLPFWEM